jgi:hypothetical protein
MHSIYVGCIIFHTDESLHVETGIPPNDISCRTSISPKDTKPYIEIINFSQPFTHCKSKSTRINKSLY